MGAMAGSGRQEPLGEMAHSPAEAAGWEKLPEAEASVADCCKSGRKPE